MQHHGPSRMTAALDPTLWKASLAYDSDLALAKFFTSYLLNGQAQKGPRSQRADQGNDINENMISQSNISSRGPSRPCQFGADEPLYKYPRLTTTQRDPAPQPPPSPVNRR